MTLHTFSEGTNIEVLLLVVTETQIMFWFFSHILTKQ